MAPEKQNELINIFDEVLLAVLNARIEKQRQLSTQNETYIKYKNKMQALLNNANDDCKATLLEFEELKTLLENITTTNVIRELTKDIQSIFKLLFHM